MTLKLYCLVQFVYFFVTGCALAVFLKRKFRTLLRNDTETGFNSYMINK